MARYSGLTSYLMCVVGEVVEMKFGGIEEAIGGPLPESAYKHRPWWANQKEGNRSQSDAWQAAGWETRDVDMARQSLKFVRVANREQAFETASKYARSAKAGLSIAEAKIGLAEFYDVQPEHIEILIRG